MGICATSATCTRFGGRASGSCSLGRVCCISKLSTINFNSMIKSKRKITATNQNIFPEPKRYRQQLRPDNDPQQYLLEIAICSDQFIRINVRSYSQIRCQHSWTKKTNLPSSVSIVGNMPTVGGDFGILITIGKIWPKIEFCNLNCLQESVLSE